MTTILADDFDSLANWTGTGSIVPGRNGTGAQISGSSALVYAIPAGPLRTAGETVRFSYRTSSLGTTNLGICEFASDAGATRRNHVTLSTGPTGALTVRLGGVGGLAIGVTAPGVIAANVWATIEMAVHLGDAPNGVVVLKVDGIERLHLTGVDTFAGGSVLVLGRFALLGNGITATAIFDDFLLTDDDPAADLPDPIPPTPLRLSVVVVGFEHTITPGRWQSTLHTSTTTVTY